MGSSHRSAQSPPDLPFLSPPPPPISLPPSFPLPRSLVTLRYCRTAQEELLKSRKWSARNRNAQDKICRVWEERGADYNRLQREFEEAEAIRQEKARQRREMEAAQVKFNLEFIVNLMCIYMKLADCGAKL